MCKPYEFGVLDPGTGSFCSQFQLNEAHALSCASFDETQLAAVQMQLCNGWCGAAHFSSSPLCGRYDDPALVCGVEARAYDQQNPDPSKRWIEPPGLSASARCSDSAPRPPIAAPVLDAGVSLEPGRRTDAGAAPTIDGAHGGSSAPALAVPVASGAHEAAPAESGDEGEESAAAQGSEDGNPVRAKRSRGGGCQLTSAREPNHGASWLTFVVVATLARPKRRRGAR
jgi:hypothetical protein